MATTIITLSNGNVVDATELNTNFSNLKTTADAALPTSGGTLTGALSISSGGLTVSGTTTFNTAMNASGITSSGTISSTNLSATKLGIGTSSPSSAIEIYNSTTPTATAVGGISTTTLTLSSITTGTPAIGQYIYGVGISVGTYITSGSGLSWTVSTSQTVSAGTTIYFVEGISNRFRFNQTDTTARTNQPIGTIEFYDNDSSSPGAGVKAFISAIDETSTPDSSIVFGTLDSATGEVSAKEKMRLDSNGNLGVGTTTPVEKLQVTGNTRSTTFLSGSDGSATNPAFLFAADSGMGIFRPTTNTFAISTSATERLRITNTGYVGIGITSPSESLQVAGNIRSSTLISGSDGSAANPAFLFAADSGMGIFRQAVNSISISTAATERLRVNASGDLILTGSVAQKLTGSSWSNPSDIRLKENIVDYEKGLNELMKIKVKKWEYNGKGNTIKGTKSLGIIANEIEMVLPDMVSTYQEKLNEEDEFLSEIKKVDSSEITWLLVKAIQEQQSIITSLNERIESLESKVV